MLLISVDAIQRANSIDSAKFVKPWRHARLLSVTGRYEIKDTHDALRGVVIIEMKDGKQTYKETVKP